MRTELEIVIAAGCIAEAKAMAASAGDLETLHCMTMLEDCLRWAAGQDAEFATLLSALRDGNRICSLPAGCSPLPS